MPVRIHIIQGRLEQQPVDAIVNAANVELLGGGGVDGAIHKAAGPELRRYCACLPEVSPGVRCRTAEAHVTPGFGLPARHIIHTVGPMFYGSPTARALHYRGEVEERDRLQGQDPRDLLAQTIRTCLTLAEKHQFRSIAFPAISCGVFGCKIMVFVRQAHTVLNEKAWDLDDLYFVLFRNDEFNEFIGTWGFLESIPLGCGAIG